MKYWIYWRVYCKRNPCSSALLCSSVENCMVNGPGDPTRIHAKMIYATIIISI